MGAPNLLLVLFLYSSNTSSPKPDQKLKFPSPLCFFLIYVFLSPMYSLLFQFTTLFTFLLLHKWLMVSS